MDTAADAIKRALSMDTVARFYGYRPNRGNYISCPFHKDKTASLKVYEQPGRGFHCYGCGKGGSVIDFVMELSNVDYPAALAQLNADFHLGLSMDKPDPSALAQARRRREEEERRRAIYEAEYYRHVDDFSRLYYAFSHKQPKQPEDMDNLDPEYVEACHRLEGLEYWFQTNPHPRKG
jgi:hypothetical protein